MTTREFIQKTYNTTNERWGTHGYDRWCSSVKTDKNGTVYSYGSHYPLAFRVNYMDFINTSGYSNTTAKHINWAWQAVGYDAIGVKLWREDAQVIASDYTTEDQKIQAIKNALRREILSLKEQMQAKKRKNTQVYAHLEYQLEQVQQSWNKVTA